MTKPAIDGDIAIEVFTVLTDDDYELTVAHNEMLDAFMSRDRDAFDTALRRAKRVAAGIHRAHELLSQKRIAEARKFLRVG